MGNSYSNRSCCFQVMSLGVHYPIDGLSFNLSPNVILLFLNMVFGHKVTETEGLLLQVLENWTRLDQSVLLYLIMINVSYPLVHRNMLVSCVLREEEARAIAARINSSLCMSIYKIIRGLATLARRKVPLAFSYAQLFFCFSLRLRKSLIRPLRTETYSATHALFGFTFYSFETI